MSQPPDPLSGANLAFVEELYGRYLDDPESVDESWRNYFAPLAAEDGNGGGRRPASAGPRFRPASIFHAPAAAAPRDVDALRHDKVDQLINAYRVRGHLLAELDPLGRPRPPVPELETPHGNGGQRHLLPVGPPPPLPQIAQEMITHTDYGRAEAYRPDRSRDQQTTEWPNRCSDPECGAWCDDRAIVAQCGVVWQAYIVCFFIALTATGRRRTLDGSRPFRVWI